MEEGGSRWSKPHVATLSLHSLFELRSLLLNGPVLLDADAQTLIQITDIAIDMMANSGHLPFNSKERVCREMPLKINWVPFYRAIDRLTGCSIFRSEKLCSGAIVISTRRTRRTARPNCPLSGRWQTSAETIPRREVSSPFSTRILSLSLSFTKSVRGPHYTTP